MKDLVDNFSFYEIIIFIILFAGAVKGVVDFYDWSKARLKKIFDEKHGVEEQQENVNEKLKDCETHIDHLEDCQTAIIDILRQMHDKVDMLIDSDKDDIKSFITKEHHFYCYVQGWIDDYSLECCERRYGHYVDEGGNSFIAGLMNELRALPRHPPKGINGAEYDNHDHKLHGE